MNYFQYNGFLNSCISFIFQYYLIMLYCMPQAWCWTCNSCQNKLYTILLFWAVGAHQGGINKGTATLLIFVDSLSFSLFLFPSPHNVEVPSFMKSSRISNNFLMIYLAFHIWLSSLDNWQLIYATVTATIFTIPWLYLILVFPWT